MKIRKGVGNRSSFQDQSKVLQEYKKEKYDIRNVSEKDLLKIIKEFEIKKCPFGGGNNHSEENVSKG